MLASPVPPRSRLQTSVAIAATLAVLATAVVFVLVVPSSSAGDGPMPVSSPRVVTREYGPLHVRSWDVSPGEVVRRRVAANAWRRTTAGKADVGVCIEAYGVVEGASLSVDVAVAEDLAAFLTQAARRAPAELAPIVNEAVALWTEGTESSFECRLDLKTGAVEIIGSRGSVTIDAAQVASAIREAIEDAITLRRAPGPLARLAK